MTYQERIQKYVDKIKAGLMSFAQVPARYLKDVKAWFETSDKP